MTPAIRCALIPPIAAECLRCGGEWHDALSQAIEQLRTYRTPQEKEFLELKADIQSKHGYDLENNPDAVPQEVHERLSKAVRAMDQHILANKQLYADAPRKPFGHDGIIVHDVLDMTAAKPDSETGSHNPYTTVYVAFHPHQIKSATGNKGKFDPSNPDIRENSHPER